MYTTTVVLMCACKPAGMVSRDRGTKPVLKPLKKE